MIDWNNFWPAFWPALVGTLQVFAIGSAGFVLTRKGWLGAGGLAALGQLVGLLTMPCLIFYRFATQFDPQTFPDWWKFALMGAAITGFGLVLGKLVALRHGNNEEATLLVGFQNAGFFVLPMLQVMLPAADYPRASLMLFVFVIPFNASLWTVGTWLLLKKKGFDARTILTPSFVATVGSLLIFGAFHDQIHLLNNTLLWQVLFGEGVPGGKPGAMQNLGDLTVPLATLTMGGSIAVNVRGKLADIPFKRAALEVTIVKLIVYPLLGYFLVRQFMHGGDPVVWTLLMLEFAAPPALALGVFSQQFGYNMKIIPAACLISYILCLFTVPFFVALSP